MPAPFHVTAHDLDQVLPWTLLRAARRLIQELEEALVPHGLTPVQFGALAQLAAAGPTSQVDLAKVMVLRPQSVAAILETLASRELVTWQGARGRGRRSAVVLTSTGVDVLRAAWDSTVVTGETSWSGLDHAEAAVLNDTLLRVLRS